MAIRTEQRLKQIDNELQALKATYMVSGGTMKLYESVSPIYTNDDTPEMRVRFIPTYATAESTIISSIFYRFTDSNGTAYDFSEYAYIEPQDSNNYLTLRFPALDGTIRLSVVATSPGTFTRIL